MVGRWSWRSCLLRNRCQAFTVILAFIIMATFFWRGLWTWPAWVNCAPAFNHKPGVYEIVFLKKPHRWTGELGIGQRKGCYMEHCGSGTPQPANKFQMADRWMKLQETQLLLHVAQHCSVFVFPLQKVLCWKFLNFLLRNKALVDNLRSVIFYCCSHPSCPWTALTVLEFKYCFSSHYQRHKILI